MVINSNIEFISKLIHKYDFNTTITNITYYKALDLCIIIQNH